MPASIPQGHPSDGVTSTQQHGLDVVYEIVRVR